MILLVRMLGFLFSFRLPCASRGGYRVASSFWCGDAAQLCGHGVPAVSRWVGQPMAVMTMPGEADENMRRNW
jgi:hypothetical protein